MNEQQINKLIHQLLTAFGENPGREGLRDTPDRVAQAYKEILGGYERKLSDEITVFENELGYNNIIYSGKITFFSVCEHHLLPFFGTAHLAYVPDKKIIGLSKLARAVDIYSRRLQDQERITVQVANELEKLLKPKGLAIVLEGQHLCNMARGVKQFDSNMKTMALRGTLDTDKQLYERFMQMIDD